MRKFLLMATIALFATACQNTANQSQPKEDPNACPTVPELEPITKPQITLSDGRLTPEALWAMGRIGSVQPNPITEELVYTVTYYSVKENRSTSWIRIAKELESGKLITLSEFIGHSPAWHKDMLFYINADGKVVCRTHNGNETILTGFNKDIDGFLVSPQGDKILLVAQVKTRLSTADKYPDLPLASGRVVDDLMYKHWDEWTDTAPHPFLCTLKTVVNSKDTLQTIDTLEVINKIDLLEGTPYESPMKPFGGVEQLAWNPEGTKIAYTCRKKIGLEYALSTNSDIYLYDIATGTHTNLTESNKGYDTNPSYSPDGQWIAWQSMERDGYESDENRLMVQNLKTGEKQFLTQGIETNVDAYYWKDSTHLVYSAVWHGTAMLYQVNLEGERECLTTGQYDFVPGGNIGNTYYCLRHSMREANEIFCFTYDEKLEKEKDMTNLSDSAKLAEALKQSMMNPNGEIVQLTFENVNIYTQIERGKVVARWQKTSDGQDMLTWIIYPPHFDSTKKYPTLLYCEGGPQSPVSQFWSYRWNFMMMAANDYIIVAPNRRGLPGFGNAWNEQISGDYGGQCMRDYLAAIDEFAANESYVDRDRLGCVGASFGGFSVYWLAGHHDKRFKAFIAHDGIFNMQMQYLETEEKWFANWDMGGAYWDKQNAIAQRTFANSPHLFVDKWDTPILCIHGEKDYRILANQSMAAFDAAKMRGVEAQLLIFPDENHWVLKPQNGILWQRTFAEWLDKWLK